MKLCSNCGYTGDSADFLTDKNICKPCNNARRRQAYAAMAEADKADLLARNRQWRHDNQEEVRAQKREYERNHRKAAQERLKLWRQGNASHVRRQRREYYEANSDSIKARVAQWRADNPQRHQAINAARRARVKGADGADYTTVEHIAGRWDFYGSRCWVCGGSAEATDHVIPLADGGSHWPANLRPICTSCNSRRPKQFVKAWMDP